MKVRAGVRVCCCLASASYRRRTVPRPKCVRNKSKSTTEDRVGRREEVGVGWNGVGWSGGGQEEKRREERPTASDNWRRLAVDGTERYSLPPPSLLLLYHPLTLLYSTPCDDRPTDRLCDAYLPPPLPLRSPFLRSDERINSHRDAHTHTQRKNESNDACASPNHPPTHPLSSFRLSLHHTHRYTSPLLPSPSLPSWPL